MGFSRDAARPMLKIQIQYRNLSVHDMQISQPEGFVTYRGERLPEPPAATNSPKNVPDGANGVLRFEIFIAEVFRDAVCEEEDTGRGEIRNLGLNGLYAMVRVQGNDSTVKWGLGLGNAAIRPNR